MTQVIDDSEIFNQPEGDSLEQIDKMMMSQYLEICKNQGQLNTDQCQFYLNQLWEHDETFINNVKDLGLWEGYLSYQEQLSQVARQSREQRTLMKQTIAQNQAKIADSQTKISELEREIEKIKPDHENSQNRYRQFPDNPRLKAEYDKQQGIFDTFQNQITRLQQVISDLTIENDLITSELTQP